MTKKLAAAAPHPKGYFSEPAVAWFGTGWVPRLSDPRDPLYLKGRGDKGAKSTAVRERAMEEGESWAVGYAGPLSPRRESAVDITDRSSPRWLTRNKPKGNKE